jgi:Domain of unknown function (DUF4331)
VIGVYASASRQRIRTFFSGGDIGMDGDFVQVSRLGMPLTNEAIIPLGLKDKWNSVGPDKDLQFASYFTNPELGLYMDDSQFGTAVPGLKDLRIQSKSLGSFDFRNGKAGLYGLKGNAALNGTALSEAAFGSVLLPNPTSPRAVDILPIFYTGVPNLAPYQLATGKGGNPLAVGKPFIHNFLPTLGDLLRINMAVPATPRNSADFSTLGLVGAAVLGLTDARYNGTKDLQFIPNMDGFPNGRRLEDDVTTIELQAVGGVVLAAIGLWYDDFVPGTTASPVTPNLVKTLTFNAGVTKNDTTFKAAFPYVQTPWRGFRGGNFAGTKLVNATNTNKSERISSEPVEDKISVAVLGNPVTADEFTVEVKGAKGESLEMDLVNIQGQVISHQSVDEANTTERRTFKIGKEIGTYFLRTVSPNGRSTVKVFRY